MVGREHADERERRLVEELRERGLVTGETSRWGRPLEVLRRGHEPQRLVDATAQQRLLAANAYAVPVPGPGLCATWVERVFQAAGLGFYPGDARTVYQRDCHLADTALLRVGMVVGVPAAPYTAEALAHGHVGIYVGDGVVRDSAEDVVRSVPLGLWLLAYGLMVEPRWGWMAGIPLG